MRAAERNVNIALDRYVAVMRQRGNPDARGVRAQTLAALVHATRDEMSEWLQEYREAQEHHRTRYGIGCEGYGTAARWSITRRPGVDPVRVQRRRVTHLPYVTNDAVDRYVRDVRREINPSLANAPDDATIARVSEFAKAQLVAVARFVWSQLGGDDNGGANTPVA